VTPSADILLPEMRPYKISNVHNTHIFKLSLAQEHRYTYVYINTLDDLEDKSANLGSSILLLKVS